MSYTIEGASGAWEVVIGLEVHAQVISQSKLFSGAATAFGAEPNTQVSFVDAGFPGMLPVIEPRVRGASRAHRARARGAGQPGQPVRPQELFLRRPAGRLSDQPVRAPDRRRRRGRGRARRRQQQAHRRHPAASRAGRRQVAARPARDQELHRPQPLRRRADGDRQRARHAQPGGGRRLPAQAAHDPALSRHLRRQHGGRAPCAPTSTSRCAAMASRSAPAARSRTSTRSVSSCRRSRRRRRRQIAVWEDGGTVKQETRLFDPSAAARQALDAQQGRRARLPLFPGPRFVAAGAGRELGGGTQARACPSCRTPSAPASCRSMACSPYDAGVLVAEKETAAFYEMLVKGGAKGSATRSWRRTG